MDKTRSPIGRSRSSFAQTDRYSGPRTLALRAGLGRAAADTLRLVKTIKASEEYLLLTDLPAGLSNSSMRHDDDAHTDF